MSKKSIRKISQGLFLLFFIFLFIQTESKGSDTLGYPVKLFLDFDPLIFITTFFASHGRKIPSVFFLSLSLVAVTVLLGRVFCGWICPLGTLHNIIGSLKRRHTRKMHSEWFRAKYYILFVLISSSVFTLQLTGIMDPVSLLIRSFSLGIFPLLNHGMRAFFDSIYDTNIPLITGVSEPVYDFLKNHFLSFREPYYLQAILIGSLFIGILGLNLVERRFWCKYLCPLGALLGLLSRYSLLKREVSEGCTSCGICTSRCQGGGLRENNDTWKNTECLACFDCDDICPQKAVTFGMGRKAHPSMDLGRRQVMLSLASGMLTVPLVRSTPFSRTDFANPVLLRPPGSLEETEFLKRCVKCGECMKVCLTNGLQPAFLEAGFEGLWSPKLIPRIGYCEYRCTLCGQVCPTGAIQRLTLEDKMKTRIGLAMIDKGRCLPYAHSTPCIVCQEVCPTSPKSIWFEELPVRDRSGREIIVKQPHVDLDRCIGCGICEAKCPVGNRPAIYVTNIGESRSKTNQLLLV
jgi:polyferredoxin/formate hydrogenlyase subunit 6/NADH:ubiquinone oxidoreductase subunit I